MPSKGKPVAIKFKEHGIEAMIDQVGRLAEKPPFQVIGELEKVLARQFIDTQTKVHVITGSLKLSGRTSSDFDGEEWRGVISYGGRSTGPNDPVTYAIYELARHGTHDFFRGVYGEDFNVAYEDVLESWYREVSGG